MPSRQNGKSWAAVEAESPTRVRQRRQRQNWFLRFCLPVGLGSDLDTRNGGQAWARLDSNRRKRGVGPRQAPEVHSSSGQEVSSQAPGQEGLMGPAGGCRAWALDPAPGQIHAPDKTGTGDTGGDPTEKGREGGRQCRLISASRSTPPLQRPRATDGSSLRPSLLGDPDTTKRLFLGAEQGRGRSGRLRIHNRSDRGARGGCSGVNCQRALAGQSEGHLGAILRSTEPQQMGSHTMGTPNPQKYREQKTVSLPLLVNLKCYGCKK